MRAHADFAPSQVYRCGRCRHMYCWPEPTLAELTAHYENKYHASRLAHIGPEYHRMMVRRAQAQAAFIARHASPGSAVDVGCGIGALAARLRELGWDSRGFDGDPEVVNYGRANLQADIEQGSLANFLAATARVDLLCMSHVLEHLNDLLPTLRRIVATVRPGGHLFVEVPNEPNDCPADMESHLHFFSRQSLAGVMEAAGLRVLDCRVCGPPSHASATRSSGLWGRIESAVASRARRALGRTIWDGWYEHYDQGDVGVWIRCLATRPI